MGMLSTLFDVSFTAFLTTVGVGLLYLVVLTGFGQEAGAGTLTFILIIAHISVACVLGKPIKQRKGGLDLVQKSRTAHVGLFGSTVEKKMIHGCLHLAPIGPLLHMLCRSFGKMWAMISLHRRRNRGAPGTGLHAHPVRIRDGPAPDSREHPKCRAQRSARPAPPGSLAATLSVGPPPATLPSSRASVPLRSADGAIPRR